MNPNLLNTLFVKKHQYHSGNNICDSKTKEITSVKASLNAKSFDGHTESNNANTYQQYKTTQSTKNKELSFFEANLQQIANQLVSDRIIQQNRMFKNSPRAIFGIDLSQTDQYSHLFAQQKVYFQRYTPLQLCQVQTIDSFDYQQESSKQQSNLFSQIENNFSESQNSRQPTTYTESQNQRSCFSNFGNRSENYSIFHSENGQRPISASPHFDPESIIDSHITIIAEGFNEIASESLAAPHDDNEQSPSTHSEVIHSFSENISASPAAPLFSNDEKLNVPSPFPTATTHSETNDSLNETTSASPIAPHDKNEPSPQIQSEANQSFRESIPASSAAPPCSNDEKLNVRIPEITTHSQTSDSFVGTNTSSPVALHVINDAQPILLNPQPPSEIQIGIKTVQRIKKSLQRKSGFNNRQMTCYLNSVLQCLINSPGFFDFFKNSDTLKEVAFEFQKICKYFGEEKPQKAPYNTDALKKKISQRDETFDGSGMQDAQEFLRSFLDLMHEDLNEIKEYNYILFDVPFNIPIPDLVSQWRGYSLVNDKSIVFNSFQGIISNQIQCKCCSTKMLTCSNFLDLSLSLPQEGNSQNSNPISLESLLNRFFFQTEQLDFPCESCSYGKTEQKVLLSVLPDLLVFHLKRFSIDYDRRGNQKISKINTPVSFPTTQLDMKFYLTPEMRKENENYTYDLYGIVLHGGNIHGGHYTAHCKNPIDDTWNVFNDESCYPIGEKVIDSYTDKGSSNPYLLFYKKRSLAQIHPKSSDFDAEISRKIQI